MHGESPIKRRESRKIWVGSVPVGGDAPGTEARRRAAFLFPPHDSAGRSDQGAGAAEPLVAPAKKRLSACGRTFRFFPVTTP